MRDVEKRGSRCRPITLHAACFHVELWPWNWYAVPGCALNRLFGYPRGVLIKKSQFFNVFQFFKYIDHSNKPSVCGAGKNVGLDVGP